MNTPFCWLLSSFNLSPCKLRFRYTSCLHSTSLHTLFDHTSSLYHHSCHLTSSLNTSSSYPSCLPTYRRNNIGLFQNFRFINTNHLWITQPWIVSPRTLNEPRSIHHCMCSTVRPRNRMSTWSRHANCKIDRLRIGRIGMWTDCCEEYGFRQQSEPEV